uniref:Putative lipocal-1 1 n=1 Tax=Amblyomma triste TaxID=251400 RepID=A0A023G9B5_AMBTT
MTLAHLILAAELASLFFSRAYGGSSSFPENNPELGAYQNEGKCFPLQDTYYIMYRNYKEDPLFGGEAKCIIIAETGPFVDGSSTFQVQYGGNNTVNVKATLLSSPGYSVQNVIQIQSIDVPQIIFNITSVYTDCRRCKIFRHSYIENGQGCTLWKTEASLNEDLACCEFVYDLVCGTSRKYQVYDNCKEKI